MTVAYSRINIKSLSTMVNRKGVGPADLTFVNNLFNCFAALCQVQNNFYIVLFGKQLFV